MDINTLRGLGTVFAMIAFIGICLWAYSDKRKASNDEAAQLPFADEDDLKKTNRGNNDG
jgi:cytochrome c oxidase cbb3-type subunit 4